jgi:hypothetical protein
MKASSRRFFEKLNPVQRELFNVREIEQPTKLLSERVPKLQRLEQRMAMPAKAR